MTTYREAKAKIERQRDLLAQTMFDALRDMYVDLDDDKTPGAMIAGMGYDGFARMFLRELDDFARDEYDRGYELGRMESQ